MSEKITYPCIESLDSFVTRVEKALLEDCKITEIVYTDTSDFSQNFKSNKQSILEAIGEGANIYAIWAYSPSNDEELMYIGQRSHKEVIARLKSHLFKRTGTEKSKLDKVKALVRGGYRIAISTVFVEPDYLRESVEAQLIYRNTDTADKLPWNTRSRDVPLQNNTT